MQAHAASSLPIAWRTLRCAGILIVLILGAIWVTWPLIASMGDQAYDQGDSLYVIWALDHNYQTLRSFRWSEYWRAPMFTPYPYSLALADHHFGTAIWTWPIYLITASSVYSYNFALLSSFVLTGVACYLLARTMTTRWWLALAVAVAGMCVPFRLAQLGHLQILITQWLVLSVWCLLQCARQPHWSYVAGFAASFLLTAWSSLYYALFQILLLGPLWLSLFVRYRWYRPSGLLRCWVWSGLAVAVGLLPFVRAYSAVYESEDFGRRLEGEVISGSAQLSDLASVTARHWIARLPGLRAADIEFSLFPGLLLTVGTLASIGIVAWEEIWWRLIQEWTARGWRWAQRRWDQCLGLAGALTVLYLWFFHAPVGWTRINLGYDYMTAPWRALAVGTLLVLAAAVLIGLAPPALRSGWMGQRGLVFWCWCGLVVFVLLSLGPLIRNGGMPLAVGPYSLVYRFLPGFTRMRVPARLCFLFLPLLVLLAARSCNALLDIFRQRPARVVIVGALFVLLAGDLAVRPMNWQQLAMGEEILAPLRWLKEAEKPGGVLVLPVDRNAPLYLFWARYHGRPLLNGYPAFMPQECAGALATARRLPEAAALDMLRARDIRYVALDIEALDEQSFGGQRLLFVCDSCPRLAKVFGPNGSRFVIYEVLSNGAAR